MKLICAVSANGYMARGPEDDMSWTPKLDKQIFQLVSSLDPAVCLVSRQTKKLMPKTIQGRRLIEISSNGLTLSEANTLWPNALLLGGPTLLNTAFYAQLLTEVIINRIPSVSLDDSNIAHKYYFPKNILQVLDPVIRIDFGEVETTIYKTNFYKCLMKASYDA